MDRSEKKNIIIRALTDSKFRETLSTNPQEAFKGPITPELKKEIGFILATVSSIEAQIGHVADHVLCQLVPIRDHN